MVKKTISVVVPATTTTNDGGASSDHDTITDRLRRNDEHADGTTLDLSYDYLNDTQDGSSISPDLLDAIRVNTSVRSLQLEGHIICGLTPEDGRQLFDALGALPRLESLFIHNFVAPLGLLTRFFRQAQALKNLTLHTAQLAGRNEREGDDFALAVRKLHCLEVVKLSDMVIAGGLSLEKVVTAIVQIPALQRVEIEMEQGGKLSCEALEALCLCSQMRELRLWRITLEPEHLILAASVLRDNHSVKEIELGEMGYADHTAESYRAVANMLQHNTCLEGLELINFSGLDDEGCVALANSLESNRTLRHLNIRGCDNFIMGSKAAKSVANMFARNTTLREWSMNSVGIRDEGAVEIAHALKQDNSTLQTLIFQKMVGNTEQGFVAFVEMLRNNVTLERVYPEAIGDIKAQADFWLGLNQLRLRNLQLNIDANREEFLELLSRHGAHLDRIYYLLSSNPEVIEI